MRLPARQARATLPLFLAAMAVTSLGCTVPVAAGVGDGDANRILVALDRAGVDATKEADPAEDGRFRIVVAGDDTARALATMHDEGLPRPNPSGVLTAVDRGALVPSRAAEHAQVVAGLAGDLERTLEGVDGVVSARVHLNLPDPDPLRPFDAPTAKATGSVLLEHRGSSPPIASSDVRSLVAGGVAGLAPADIAVVLLERANPAPEARPLAHLGPIAVARTSLGALQLTFGLLFLVVALLAVAVLRLWARLRAVRGEKAT